VIPAAVAGGVGGRDDRPVLADRYAWLAGLLAPVTGARVADLGCGERSVLELVRPQLGGGIAVGVDSDVARCGRSGRRRRSRLADAVCGRRSGRPPTPGQRFDAIFSHDVLEQLPDPDALLRETRLVLRPGGRLVLGHADFDTAVFAGADLQLTRRLVHAYCDIQHAWMARADGTIGRRLPELVLRSPLTLSQVTARVLLSRSLREGGFGRFAVDHLVQALAEAGAASPEELAGWRADLEAAAGRGAFLLSLNDYVVLASRR
jgi:SAM-dependent methyltransferase